MDIYKKDIIAGTDAQWAVGDNRKDAFISGVYSIIRGRLRQTGQIDISSDGDYSSAFVGPTCGVGIYGSVSSNKILLKVTADNSDSNITSVKFSLKKVTI